MYLESTQKLFNLIVTTAHMTCSVLNKAVKSCSVALGDGGNLERTFKHTRETVPKLPDDIATEYSGENPPLSGYEHRNFSALSKLASYQKILKITNLNNSRAAYQPPIVL